jgi:hypothetical protein
VPAIVVVKAICAFRPVPLSSSLASTTPLGPRRLRTGSVSVPACVADPSRPKRYVVFALNVMLNQSLSPENCIDPVDDPPTETRPVVLVSAVKSSPVSVLVTSSV